MRKFINFVAFQVGWFACVLGAAGGDIWTGPAVVCVVAILYARMSQRPSAAALFLAAAALIGGLTDTLLGAFGIIAPVRGDIPHPLSPPWLIALWVNFGTTLDICMGWLRRRPVLASVLGAVGGPLAYYSGGRLGAVAFGEPLALSLVCVGLAWAAALPLLYRLLEMRPDLVMSDRSPDASR